MGRQTQLHVLPKDVNELLVAMHDREPLEVAMARGNTATPERLAFAKAQPPYYVIDERTESVFELSLSALRMWEGRPALTQGRIYGVFENKQAEFKKCYERIVRYIRRHWRKNPAVWMGGYLGPAASDWLEGGGGLLLPNYIPVRSDWIQRLGEQHPH